MKEESTLIVVDVGIGYHQGNQAAQAEGHTQIVLDAIPCLQKDERQDLQRSNSCY